VLGTRATDGIRFRYPDDRPVEAALASVGIGIYLTGTGATAAAGSARNCSPAKPCC